MTRAARRRKLLAVAADDRAVVFKRDTPRGEWRPRCVGWRINPGCKYYATDPHELIPVGRGGKRESWNRVSVCRCCHREAQGRVGGLRLIFDWPGKADGAKPNADQPGNVTCYWRKGDDGRRDDGRG